MSNLNKINTVSNYLSFLRLLLGIPFWFLLNEFNDPVLRYAAFGLAIFAALTDILDGYFARKFNQVTEWGKIIDPIADKICMAIIILKLFLINEIPGYYLALIVGRDLLIFIGGILVSRKLKKVLPSNMLGKITVVIIGIVILLIMLQIDRTTIFFKLFYGLSILLIIASLVGYTIRAIEFLRKREYGSI